MVTITTVRRFYDLREHRWRLPGDTFVTSGERAAQIEAALPGYVAVEPVHEPVVEDLSAMTVGELRDICRTRGIKVPKGAKKTDIIALLEA